MSLRGLVAEASLQMSQMPLRGAQLSFGVGELCLFLPDTLTDRSTTASVS